MGKQELVSHYKVNSQKQKIEQVLLLEDTPKMNGWGFILKGMWMRFCCVEGHVEGTAHILSVESRSRMGTPGVAYTVEEISS